jgi:hypothetical protein
MYVKEDLGHIVNMDEEAISREIANLLPPKSSTFSGQLSAETVCSSIGCLLTRTMLKSVQPPQMLSMLPQVLYIYVVALCTFGLLEFYPFTCLIMHGYMHNEYQVFKTKTHA